MKKAGNQKPAAGSRRRSTAGSAVMFESLPVGAAFRHAVTRATTFPVYGEGNRLRYPGLFTKMDCTTAKYEDGRLFQVGGRFLVIQQNETDEKRP
jgi:hypothetical protein